MIYIFLLFNYKLKLLSLFIYILFIFFPNNSIIIIITIIVSFIKFRSIIIFLMEYGIQGKISV